jgi:hypothetical protein
MKIEFINTLGVPDEYIPKPASEYIPDWYKNTNSYVDKNKVPSGTGGTKATIKRCMPVFDAITAGYIVTTFVDIHVYQENGIANYQYPAFDAISFHPISQADLYPAGNGIEFPKWNSPWGIKTPPGYSCLVVQPFHRDLPFTILPGIVDTDKYPVPINFPCVLNNPSFEGLIPAGTPLAQIIPFKRDSWKSEYNSKKTFNEINEKIKLLKSKFYDGYKTFFRVPKEFK